MSQGRTATDRRRDASSLALVKNAASSHFSAVDLDAREVVGDVGDGRYPHTARFHPDGRHAYLLYISSAHLEVLDRETMETVGRIDDLGTAPVGSSLSPEGSRLFVGAAAGLPTDADGTPEGPGVMTFAVGEDAVPPRDGARELSRCAGMRIGPDGRLYVALKREGAIAALSADADLAVVDRFETGAKPHDLYRVPGTPLLAVNHADESYAAFLDTERGTVTPAATGENPHGIAFADGHHYRRAVFPAREDERVAIVDLDAVSGPARDPTVGLVDVGTTTGFAATTPDGRYAVVDSYDEAFVTVLDVAACSVAGRVHVGGEPLHVVMAPDGGECYVGNMEIPTVAVLDTEPLLDGRPGDVTLAATIDGLGEKPSGIFVPGVNA